MNVEVIMLQAKLEIETDLDERLKIIEQIMVLMSITN